MKEKKEFESKLKDLWTEFNNADSTNKQQIGTMEKRVEKLDQKVRELPNFIEKTHEEFERYTSLTSGDMSFLGLAIVLQSARQVLLNLYKERIDDQESANKTLGHDEEHSNRSGKRYYASIEEITTNPVPFDSVQKEDVVKRNDNPKLSGMNHRYKAIGHDPYLGLIFGTANIMTSTITLNKGRFHVSTYHVHSGENISKSGKPYKIDKLSAKADTGLMFKKIYERLQTEKAGGYKALAYALFKECVHLRSDIRTKKALPIPLLSSVSPNLTRIMGFLEIDYLTIKIIEKEYVLSTIIDLIIRILYNFCYDEEKDVSQELYRVRCLKILLYSNEIATTSSAIQTWVRMAYCDITSAKYFDFGGAINTLYREMTTPLKIAEIQHEYLTSKGINYLKN